MRNIADDCKISKPRILQVSCNAHARGRTWGPSDLFRVDWGNVGRGGGASGSFTQGVGVLVLSRLQGQREVGALGNDGVVQRMSCNGHQGRHDIDEPVDAKGKNLFCVS